jgi:hypothetical protein
MTFDPAAHPACILYFPNQEDEPGGYFIATTGTGTPAANPGDLVGYANGGVGSPFIASSDARRPTLVADGGSQFDDSLGLRINSTSYLNSLHVNQEAFVLAVVQLNDGDTQQSRILLDNTDNQSAANNQGFTLAVQAQAAAGSLGGIPQPTQGAIGRMRLKNLTGTAVIELYTEERLSAPTATRELIQGWVNPDGLSYLQVGKGRKSYGRIAGAAGSGNATYAVFLGNRAAFTQGLDGKIFALAVYTEHPGQEEIDAWIDRFGQGSIAGSPEIRVGEHHLNLIKLWDYSPACEWFEEQRVSGVAASGAESPGGAVFNDSVSTDNGWAGSVHGSEVVRSMTVSVDGAAHVALVDGTIYEGASSVQVIRETTMGVSIDLREVHTIKRNSWRYRTHQTRLGDARTFTSSFYPVRLPRTNLFPDYIFLGADGTILASGTVTAVDATGPSGTVAVAQWNATTSQVALVTMTLNADLFDLIIIYGTDGRRIYTKTKADPNTLLGDEGDTLESEALQQLFTSTAGTWQDDAVAAMLATLYPPMPSGHQLSLSNGLKV